MCSLKCGVISLTVALCSHALLQCCLFSFSGRENERGRGVETELSGTGTETGRGRGEESGIKTEEGQGINSQMFQHYGMNPSDQVMCFLLSTECHHLP